MEQIDAVDGKHVFPAVNQDITIEELLEVVFFVQSMLRLHSKDQ
jgi:hypothetical protein